MALVVLAPLLRNVRDSESGEPPWRRDLVVHRHRARTLNAGKSAAWPNALLI